MEFEMFGIAASDVLFLMACSDRKAATVEPVSLIELYDGPTWQTFRKYRPGGVCDSAVVILSGKFGWTSGLCESLPYNERISAQKVDRLVELGAQDLQRDAKGAIVGWTPAQLVSRASGKPYKAVVICGGAEYRRAFDAVIPGLRDLGFIERDAEIVTTAGGIGDQRGQLGEILRALNQAPAEDLTPEGIQLVIPGAERVQAPSKMQMELF